MARIGSPTGSPRDAGSAPDAGSARDAGRARDAGSARDAGRARAPRAGPRPGPSGQHRTRGAPRLLAALLVGLVLLGVGHASTHGPRPDPGRIWGLAGLQEDALAATASSRSTPDDLSAALVFASDERLDPTRLPYDLLVRSQLPSGAIKVEPDGERIVPYFSNLAAMALVPTRPAEVRNYLVWYLTHLNRPDRFGLYGTIYDYTVDPSGRERATGDYDSADSYAATFLSLLRAYVEATGDHEFVRAHLADIELVAGVIPGLQDTDGLVWATAFRREKFLMDNAEDYRGLRDYAEVLSWIGAAEAAKAAGLAAERIGVGVDDRLWDSARGNYAWAVYTYWLGGYRLGEVRQRTSWRVWYPDAMAQVFPIICGLLEPSDPRAVSLYASLNQWYPGWVNQTKPDPHPWSVLGYTAAAMGDDRRAAAFLRATSRVYLNEPGPYSRLSWELAWYLLTVAEMAGPGA